MPQPRPPLKAPPQVRPPPPRPVPRPVPRPAPQPRPAAGAPVPKANDKVLNYGTYPGFQRPHAARIQSQPFLEQPRSVVPPLYAVIGTWHEADVIEATVRNCFANGCTKVFIVDNESPDGTRERAIAAGAEVVANYHTDYYDDDRRLRLMNDQARKVTEHECQAELWWIFLDADEFPCGPQGERLLDVIARLGPQHNTVGARAFDLYPTLPTYDGSRHPADNMPMGLPRADSYYCNRNHWKHPLFCVRNGVYALAQSRGAHVPYLDPKGNVPALVEPVAPLILFHAPFRGRDATEARLRQLCSKQDALGGHHRYAADDQVTGGNGATKRWRSLEAVYAGRWQDVEVPHSQFYGKGLRGVALYPWRHVLQLTAFPRWYPNPDGGKRSLPLVEA